MNLGCIFIHTLRSVILRECDGNLLSIYSMYLPNYPTMYGTIFFGIYKIKICYISSTSRYIKS